MEQRGHDGPGVTYSATGGTITTGGLYTAGSTAGTFRVIAVQQGGTLADTSAVTLTATPPVLQAVILTPASASLATGAHPAVQRERPVEQRGHDGPER